MAGGKLHELHGALEKEIFRKLKATDRLSQPFLIELEILSKSDEISPYSVIGKNMSVGVKRKSEEFRYFNGIISRFQNLGSSGGYQLYQVELRSWLWLLSHTRDCRIFQQLTIPEILEKVFKDKNGFSDYRLDLQGPHKKFEYCVQYRESDFDFVSRLMEREGFYYYFEHEKGKHVLVVCNATSKHKKIDGDDEMLFRPPNEVAAGDEHVFRWQHRVELQPGKLCLRDYDYEKPSADLEVRLHANRKHPISDLEQYDYPGLYNATADGDRYLKIRTEEFDSKFANMEGSARSQRLSTGKLFKLKEHPNNDENGEYLIIAATTVVVSGEIEQFSTDSENRFEVDFAALPKTQTFRAPRISPQPVIAGPQTAIVVGPNNKGDVNKEVWTDTMGRVKVQFPWDREGKKDESSSCWIRVGQVWAGKGWGGINIPRVGQEVIVEFLEGDPDRPLITGRVYNGEQKVPYALPDSATQSGVISRSLPKGANDNFNELRFEDQKDKEQIYFHAERDFERIVENDDVLKVGLVKKDPGNQTIDIHGDQTETIHEGNRKITLNKGNDTLTISTGNQKVDVTKGQCEITAATKIILKVGESSIEISPAEIVIKSAQIKIAAQMKADVSATTTNIQASALLKLAGGIIKIN